MLMSYAKIPLVRNLVESILTPGLSPPAAEPESLAYMINHKVASHKMCTQIDNKSTKS